MIAKQVIIKKDTIVAFHNWLQVFLQWLIYMVINPLFKGYFHNGCYGSLKEIKNNSYFMISFRLVLNC